jgi:hypothetical protein
MIRQKIKNEIVENYSGFKIKIGKRIDTIKKGNYFVLNKNVGGDAPKEFIKVYEFGKVKKKNRKYWIGYIAKTGQKWYPAESATEYLLNKIGETIGLNIAESRLAYVGGQIRFMSKYFLKKDDILVHSAEIFAGYLSGDKGFVDQVEKEDLARNLFTFQFAQLAIKEMFPYDYKCIIDSFVQLLIFDAIVGNNDRHIYNWGVITDVSGKKQPRFSPIYDTARGLFWNDNQEKLFEMKKQPKQLSDRIKKYANNCRPKTGWEGEKNINHFQLLEFLIKTKEEYRIFVVNLCSNENKTKILALIDTEFIDLFPKSRIDLIKKCIEYRFNTINEILKS